MLSRKSIYWKRWRSTKDPDHQQAYKAYSVKCCKAIKVYYRDLETALVQSDNRKILPLREWQIVWTKINPPPY